MEGSAPDHLSLRPRDQYGIYSDALNSALNSLALGEDGRRIPGPLSRYYEITAPDTPPLNVTLDIGGKTLGLPFPAARDESAQVLIERESRLLMKGSPALVPQAWPRFYRQIFREIYSSLEPVALAWETAVREGTVKSEALPQGMLSWLQGLKYSRKGGLSDLSTPWGTLKSGEGDCDSRALIYAGLLYRFGYEAILMVSSTYSHGMAAVDITGPGARFEFQNQQWMVAELTSKVTLGQIPQDMADPEKWLGVSLFPQP